MIMIINLVKGFLVGRRDDELFSELELTEEQEEINRLVEIIEKLEFDLECLPISPRKPLPLGMGMNRRVRRGILGKLSCKTTKFLV